MDHLPCFQESNYVPIKVPFLSETPYRCRKFWSESFNVLRSGDAFESEITARSMRLLQDWLFFGILDEFLEGLNPTDFVRDAAGGPCITTEKLPQYLDKWRRTTMAKLKSQDAGTARATMRSNTKCLEEATHFILLHNTKLENAASPAPEVWLSVKALGQTLTTQLLSHMDWLGVMTLGGTFLSFPPSSVLNTRLLAAGWCPSDVARSPSLSSSFFALSMSMQGRRRTHSTCSETACNADQIDESNYATKHVREGCRCQFVGPSRDAIVSLLEKEEIPVLTLPGELKDGDEHSADIKLDVIPARASRGFVAMSHVWSDGLGNTEENELPLCQLKRIYRLSSQVLAGHGMIDGPVHIWMDTLCVPVRDEDKHYRKLAITSMAKTYESAAFVLAIDSGLVQASRLDRLEELLLRIRYSGWMRRLWTLQEAVLPEKGCLLQLRDGYINLHQLCGELYSRMGDTFEHICSWPHMRTFEIILFHWAHFECFWKGSIYRKRAKPEAGEMHRRMLDANYHGIVKLASCGEIPAQKLRSTWNAIVGRRTSKPADEPVVLAGLLYLEDEVQQILELPLVEKWKLIFSHAYYVLKLPQEIIFHSGPRPSEDGWRWITLSITETSSRLFSWKTGSRRTADEGWPGLMVYFFGLDLGRAEAFFASGFFSEDATVALRLQGGQNGIWYHCKRQSWKYPAAGTKALDDTDGRKTAVTDVLLEADTGSRYALILQQREPLDNESGGYDFGHAILVSFVDDHVAGETRNVRYVCNVRIVMADGSAAAQYEKIANRSARAIDQSAVLGNAESVFWQLGQLIDEEEEWCVG